MLAVKFSRRCG